MSGPCSLNTISHWNGTVLFGEMSDSRSGAGNVEDDPQTSRHTKKKKKKWSYQRLLSLYQKDSGAILKRLPLAEERIIWASIRIIMAMTETYQIWPWHSSINEIITIVVIQKLLSLSLPWPSGMSTAYSIHLISNNNIPPYLFSM